jgi:hypothetical protein
MSTDFEVEIRPDSTGTNLIVSLTASDPAMNINRREFLRPLTIDIAENNISDLRSGNPTVKTVKDVSKKLSDWLIGSDMQGFVHTAIHGNGPIRLIFKVEQKLLKTLPDLPMELLNYEDDWIVLRRAVSAMVHELPNTPLPKPFYQSLPLKLLIVRSSPSELTVKVPPAGPICNHIIKLANKLGPNLVHIDLLSREVSSLDPQLNWDEFRDKHLPDLVVAADDTLTEKRRKQSLEWKEFREYLLSRDLTELQPGTWDNFRSVLKKSSTNYHFLVYLGHGNHIVLPGSTSKSGVLQFEKDDDGETIQAVSSNELQRQLQDRQVAVPVVMLAGCLTAAEVNLTPEDLKDISEWTYGSQGVAQRLIGSESGVQCAIGMRNQIEKDAAFAFLTTFFESLLVETPGNMEAAVRAGRVQLASPEFPPSWSAPVIFRTRGTEPMFKFLADLPKTYQLDRDDVRDQEAREASWTALLQDPNYAFAYENLTTTEERIKSKVLAAGGALLMPDMRKAAPGSTVQIGINLFGFLSVDKVVCKLSITSDVAAARIASLQSTEIFKAANFALTMSEAGGNTMKFTIESESGTSTLPQRSLLLADLSLDTITPAKYTVRIDVLETTPQVKFRPIDNVVLVTGK